MGDLGASSAEAKSRRLSFKGLGTKVATMMLGPDGQKALAPSGAAVVGQEFTADPLPLVRWPPGLLDVLPTKQRTLGGVRLPEADHKNERSGCRGRLVKMIPQANALGVVDTARTVVLTC